MVISTMYGLLMETNYRGSVPLNTTIHGIQLARNRGLIIVTLDTSHDQAVFDGMTGENGEIGGTLASMVKVSGVWQRPWILPSSRDPPMPTQK